MFLARTAHCDADSFASTLDQLQHGLRCRWECGRNKLQSIPILLPSVNVGLEMVGFGLSQDVYIDGMYNWQTKRFSFMISPFVWYLMSMQSVNRPFSIFVTLVSYANILLMMLKSIIRAFVVSKLDYCNSLLYGLPSYLIRKLQHVQNSAARLLNLSLSRAHNIFMPTNINSIVILESLEVTT